MKKLRKKILEMQDENIMRRPLYDRCMRAVEAVTGLNIKELNNIIIYEPDSKRAKVLKKLTKVVKAEAVTIGKNEIVFLRDFNMEFEYLRFFKLLAHEATHIKQMQSGRLKFSMKYFWEYGTGLVTHGSIFKAYENISTEKEAVENANTFLRIILNRP